MLPSGANVLFASRNAKIGASFESRATEASVALDIRDEIAVRQLVKSWQPSVVIHLAAVAHVVDSANSPKDAYAINLGGTITLATAVREFCPGCFFIYVSSSEVYGSSFVDRKIPVDEETLLAPANVYAASKAAADLFIGQMARNGLNALRFRPFNHTGPGQSANFVVSGFAAQIARIEQGLQPPVIKVGNLEAERDFTDVRDIVSAYVTAATSFSEAGERGEILNLASGVPRRVGDILAELVLLSKAHIEIEQDPDRMRPSEVLSVVGNSEKAHSLLAWEPQVDWHETLISVLDHWRSRVKC